MRYSYFAAITLVVILGIGGWFWAVRRGAETTGEPAALAPVDLQRGLVGYWKLQGDCRDHSGHEHHGVNHGVDLQTGTFDGRGAYVEVPASESLHLGRADFTFSAWVQTDEIVDDTLGDVLSWYDPQLRRGVTLNLNSSAG